ncbi:DUF3613 domain-containing protein [Pigmentiphaga sp. H8]|uniref:DUF3613 domain-containing protein n=1 Tax=unclassified Pigmentiphaga TaxID=2626614 RepID=UPI000F599FB0|nr:DUF3613 domain-containing protein [Pigmentiphaga sp. H8]AZG08173.1 DUF3613 domain-containing protein [Pigmentiphaga sp. H8]
MKPTSHCPHGQSASRRASRYLVLAALLAAPLAQAQNNAPVTGSMLQETPEQRARMEQAARQAQAQEQARRAAAAQQQRAASTPAAARPASSVVRQVPGPGQAPAAATQAAPAARQQVVPSPEQRVTTVITPQAATPAQPAPAAAAPAVAAAPRTEPMMATASTAPQGRSRPNGDVTSEVVRMQAEGRQAGKALPMLGATAQPSWKRYIDSYSHPIPEFYETTSQPKQ